jgi:oligo-alginate lyase
MIEAGLMNSCRLQTFILLLLLSMPFPALGTGHPTLLISPEGAARMAGQLADYPIFQRQYQRIKSTVDGRLNEDVVVPAPRDAGGGYTHEKHKSNYKAIHDAGLMYLLTGEMKYASYVRDVLTAYADMYPALGSHPVKKSSSPGRLFWQSLNEAVWLLYSIQGYDAVYGALNEDERRKIEQGLFVPMATFLSDGQPGTFDRIHNHGTWANAAVGMTGYVLGREDFVQKSLYGLDRSGKSGFLRQLDELFSPDGYYNEGPYYQRYALMPFVVFAQAIQHNNPDLGIFQYRDGVLLKAIYTTIQLSYNGLFFPLNDAIKDKGLDTTELLYAVAIAYGMNGDPALLSIAQLQGRVVLTDDGLSLARGLAERQAIPFPYKSMLFRDGAKGDRGGLVVLRSGDEPGHQALVMKNTAQGLGHGHFDKLSWLYYDNNREIVSDYGAARFLNVESKNGGAYLPENTSWAKQTIAHNTLVVDEESHFNGKLGVAEFQSPQILAFSLKENVELVSAAMTGAYGDVDFVRTMAMIRAPELEFPIILDVLKAMGEEQHQYDLPLHYQGHLVNVNFPLKAHTRQLNTLGDDNGYQHMWVRAEGQVRTEADLAQITWLEGNRFYTQTLPGNKNQRFFFTTLGASDPNFNLREENAIVQRQTGRAEHTFVSVLEAHGEYNGVLEYTLNSYSQIADLELVRSGAIDIVRLETTTGQQWALAIAYGANDATISRIHYDGREFEWKGYYQLFELSPNEK